MNLWGGVGYRITWIRHVTELDFDVFFALLFCGDPPRHWNTSKVVTR